MPRIFEAPPGFVLNPDYLVPELRAQRDALLEALKEITPSMPPVDAPCHYGIVPQEKCGHCGRIAKARAAIKAVEENT